MCFDDPRPEMGDGNREWAAEKGNITIMAQNDIGIDLGTTTIIIAQEGQGVVLNQPSVVAVDTRKNCVLEAGDKALAMVGRTPNYISAIFPLKDGVISDHTMTRELICRFVNQVYSSHMVKPRVAVCVPAAITGIESDAVVEAVMAAGARQVKATSVRVAGNHYDEEILKFVRNKFSIAIGQRTAENLKKNVACCPQKADFNETMEIKGRSLLTGLPVRVNVSTADLYEPVMRLSEQIGTAAHQVLEKTPPELAGDIYRNGVVLTGGGAQLHGLPEYLSQELKVEVTVSPDPVNCVALGTAMSLRLGDKLETGFMDATPRMGRR